MNWKAVICGIARGGILFASLAGCCHISVMDEAGSSGNSSDLLSRCSHCHSRHLAQPVQTKARTAAAIQQ